MALNLQPLAVSATLNFASWVSPWLHLSPLPSSRVLSPYSPFSSRPSGTHLLLLPLFSGESLAGRAGFFTYIVANMSPYTTGCSVRQKGNSAVLFHPLRQLLGCAPGSTQQVCVCARACVRTGQMRDIPSRLVKNLSCSFNVFP